MKRPKRIDTEAAARWVEKNWNLINHCIVYREVDGELYIYAATAVRSGNEEIVLKIPFSWLYTKRQNLTGVTKRLKAAIRKPRGKR